MSDINAIKPFEGKRIRTAWDEGKQEWFFAIVDVVAALTGSVDPSAYWRKLKERLRGEGNETVTNCHGLKMKAVDGKMRLTDVANTEQLLRISREKFKSRSLQNLRPTIQNLSEEKIF
jgi:hypothetical protein